MQKNSSLENNSPFAKVDWICIAIYFALLFIGWLNIYSASLPIESASIFDFKQIYGKQMIFIGLCFPLIGILLYADGKFYEKYSLIFYIIAIVMLLGLFVFGKTIKGQTNWYQIAGFGLQPSEFAKTATALLLAKYISDSETQFDNLKDQAIGIGILAFPVLLILMQPDAGSALIFMSLFLALYREGLPGIYLIVGGSVIILFLLSLLVSPLYLIPSIMVLFALHYYFNKKINRNIFVYLITFTVISGFILSVDYVYDNVLEPHQKERINVLFGKDVNFKKEGYNLNQSMIAIGSGGWFGKGFLEGTQTKGGFVPEQHTDYIFTTVGEEWGFMGSLVVIGLFVGLFFRILHLAEHQKTRFSRTYGYAVAGFLFVHFFVNISMLIGLFPTIGVPLPFFSYGGSSLMAFTIMLFIFLNLDANRVNEW